MARVCLVEALGHDHLEGDVEGPEQRHRRGEGGVRRVLALAGRGQRPVVVVAAAGGPGRSLHRPIRDRREGETGRTHQRLLRAAQDNVDAPLILGQLDGSDARDRVDAEDRVVPAGDLAERADVVHDAGRGLRVGDEDRPRGPVERGELGVDPVGIDPLAPFEGDVVHVGAERLAELGPALPELAAGGDDRRLTGDDEVGDGRLHRAGPGGGEAEDVVGGAEGDRETIEHPPVDLDEGRRAVVEDRLGHRLRDARRQRRRSACNQVLLRVDAGALGHGRAGRQIRVRASLAREEVSSSGP